MTVEQLRERLADVPGHFWICGCDGPLTQVVIEDGANEPFVLLSAE